MKATITLATALLAMTVPALAQTGYPQRSMGSADPAVNAVLDARPDDIRILPPVRLYAPGKGGFADWPGRIAGVREVEQKGTLFNVTDPTYQAFLPPEGRNSRTAVIVAPGGGFRQLSIESEGNDVAKWLAARGIAAFVLKYRIVQQKGPDYQMLARWDEVSFDVAQAPGVADATEAIRQIRARASDYGIDAKHVVLMGFSAGAQIAGEVALNPDVAARPDYVAPIYGPPIIAASRIPPYYLPGTQKPGQQLGPFTLPGTGTPNPAALPPFFLALSQDDFLVGDGTRGFYDALLKAGYRPEAHFYTNGVHGYGLNETLHSSRHFIEEFYWWMETMGLTRKPGDPDRKAPIMPLPPQAGQQP